MNFDQADALNEAIRAIGIRHRELAIAALAPFGIHPGHKLLLLELEATGPCTQAQLAAASGYEPPTITLSASQLEAAGLVARRPSPTDGRATIVELTDEGRALLPKLKAAWRGWPSRPSPGSPPSPPSSSPMCSRTWPQASVPATMRTVTFRATSPNPNVHEAPQARLPNGAWSVPFATRDGITRETRLPFSSLSVHAVELPE